MSKNHLTADRRKNLVNDILRINAILIVALVTLSIVLLRTLQLSGIFPWKVLGLFFVGSALTLILATMHFPSRSFGPANQVTLARGALVALLFGLLGAPDLALTQVLVETVSVALFLAAFVFLPPYQGPAKRSFRPVHFLLSLAFGLGAASLVYFARAARSGSTIADFFVRNSLPEAGGRNVVNVILVDFRGLDTLGEISVLGIAALACYALIRTTAGAGPR